MSRPAPSAGADPCHPYPTASPDVIAAHPTTAPLVEVRDLGKVYTPSPLWLSFLLRSAIDEPVVALDGVSLSVWPGELCAIVGPNGAGKSTLFRILTGLTTRTTGAATIDGFDVEQDAKHTRPLIGFMPADDRSLYLRHTCAQNLVFHGRLQGLRKPELRDRVDETLELVGLGHARNRAGYALSTGMRARLQLARALLHRPKVLILDEPTGAVDPVGSFHLLQLIQELTHEHGLAVLLSSHRLEEIDALHDNVAFLDRGRLVHWGDLDSLRSAWEVPRLVIGFDGERSAKEAEKLLARSGVDAAAAGSASITVTIPEGTGAVLEQLDGHVARIVSIEQSRMSLRELLTRLLTSGSG